MRPAALTAIAFLSAVFLAGCGGGGDNTAAEEPTADTTGSETVTAPK